ncbi:MAG: nicotinate phosphoribosyltransferase [Candidatus Omnitrophica bacterium]|nr:nicotinate phosphoribosyltransferase [Candidatus Omnitrophota bacterium]
MHREGMGLLTDLYELTMMAGYFKEGMGDRQACFEYFFRSLPPETGFAVAAGLDSFLDYLSNLRFTKEDIDHLRSVGLFEESFLDFLRDFRPTCTVSAIPEGTLVFPNEPIVQVEGDLIEVQLLETALLNFLNYSTLIASKAARICQAANGDPVMEFGLRRAHGPDGGVSGSRAAYIGGCSATSNVLAGRLFDLPVSGTHAHSWVMSYDSELESFRTLAKQFPNNCIFLVDTYDTLVSGVPNAIQVFREMREEGLDFRPAIRLDSGDLSKLSKSAHRMLVEAGFKDPLIVASGDLDENLIADLKRQGAKINSWGVGTKLITAWDSPSFNGVYKLVAVQNGPDWEPRIKISSNIAKTTDPGRKRVIRYYNSSDEPIGDVLYDSGEEIPWRGSIIGRERTHLDLPAKIDGAARGERLLEEVFVDGVRTRSPKSARDLRQRVSDQIQSMPEEYKRLRNPEIYPVLLSRNLVKLKGSLLAAEIR